MKNFLFTSESVTEGHPDKMCDRISDSILDEILARDKNARVACETIATTGFINIIGEITSTANVDYQAIARNVINEIGYTDSSMGFDGNTCAVSVMLDRQSPDIAMGVDNAFETRNTDSCDTGAGDQGMMFGYACNDTKELMPLPISLAHSLAKRLTFVRKENIVKFLRPDGKTQVTVAYENNKPKYIDTVVISTQHSEEATLDTLRKQIIDEVITKVIPSEFLCDKTKIFVNPTGRFVIGGPHGDSGLTGRKIIVDTYGGVGGHGGGCFSGKDPTKVDRSAAYAARYVAKNIVAAGLAERCEVQIAYAIGVAHPVSVMVNTFDTGKVSEELLSKNVLGLFDLRPDAIIKKFDLRRPIYRQLAAYGQMGREDLNVPWELTDMADALRKKAYE